MSSHTNFNGIKTSEIKCCKIVSDVCIRCVYTIEYYLESVISLAIVTVAPSPSISAVQMSLSPFFIPSKLANATGTTVVTDPLTYPAFVLYVIFIYLLIFSFHIYFYITPYINLTELRYGNPYGIYVRTSNYYTIHIEIIKKIIGMILMKNKNVQMMCVCSSSQSKSVSWLKNNFVETNGKFLFSKTGQFHYITYNTNYYISMIFLYINYYIYLPIFNFNPIFQVNTSEHLLTSDATSVIKDWCTSEHFVNTSEHLLTNNGGSL